MNWCLLASADAFITSALQFLPTSSKASARFFHKTERCVFVIDGMGVATIAALLR
jgi:hypothetical protein